MSPGSAARKVLMICYYYPPIMASGVVRNVAFARLLPRFGWRPVVLTVKAARDVNVGHGEREPEGVEVVRTRELNVEGTVELLQGGVNRLFELFGSELRDKYFRERLAIPDPQIGWQSWWRGSKLARDCAVIYVSCSPFSAALGGCIVKRLSGRPLVVDLRDAWTLNPYASHERFHRRVIDKQERWVFQCADAIILNSDGARKLYVEHYPEFAKKMTVIPNGFDALNLAQPDEPVREPFRIMHVGAFYGSRTPDALLEALSRLDAPVEFMQVGPPHPSFARYEGDIRIKVIPQMRHADAQVQMRSASLLYLRQGWEPDVTDYIAVAAKTYEYLATGLPILAHCPQGDNAEIVRRYAAVSYLVTSEDGHELDAALQAALRDGLTMVPKIVPEFASTFDRSALTRRLADVLAAVGQSS